MAGQSSGCPQCSFIPARPASTSAAKLVRPPRAGASRWGRDGSARGWRQCQGLVAAPGAGGRARGWWQCQGLVAVPGARRAGGLRRDGAAVGSSWRPAVPPRCHVGGGPSVTVPPAPGPSPRRSPGLAAPGGSPSSGGSPGRVLLRVLSPRPGRGVGPGCGASRGGGAG